MELDLLAQEIVPRYHGSQMSYTKMYKAPSGYKHETSKGRPSDDMAILELRSKSLAREFEWSETGKKVYVLDPYKTIYSWLWEYLPLIFFFNDYHNRIILTSLISFYPAPAIAGAAPPKKKGTA